ncbi:succinyl-diaminopimelate desuccinylase [Aestuariivirga litoralis]|uniref:succinyl-diaminopimelate desuccinylase n=1 Tax=Aestuariivirga litoralis TaxID=2650924 RepID=UPI0018C6786D|nr:succinyl-diaminopimelate desuccinylase [Aestuariivirga litoralis]MBG1232763.1 succinyl-diaminopimelate desuccinylase [Aestuariivirga litoralis]
MPTSKPATTILQDLIRCRSVTPDEGGALSYLEKLLGDAGFACHRLTFKAEGTPDVENLFARFGTAQPHLCFAGHTDVVPPGDESKWAHPPFAAEIADGKIFGRGATDMKGSIAAFAAAALDHVAQKGVKPGSISFLITGDEEGPAINGTVKVLQWMKENGHIPDHCIVGEPSCVDRLGDTIKIGRRGSLSLVVTVDGRQGHAAYPHKADNPVPKLARFIDRIGGLALDKGNEHFDPSTLAVTTFDVGNKATNVIPAQAVAKFNIRYSPELNAAALNALIQGEADKVKVELGGTWTIEAHEGADAFITRPGAFVGLVQDAIADETGLVPKLSTSGGTSDARFVKDYCPVLEFGPTNATIHQTDEHIDIEELKALSRIYARVIEKYFQA